MRKSIALISVVVAALFLVAAPAGAQVNPYEGTTTGLTTTDTTPEVGGAFVVSGDGCVPGDTVTISIGGTVIGTVTADADGAFSTTLVAPSASGSYTVNAVCGTTVLGVVVTVGGTTGTTAPPATGGVGGGAGGGGTLPTTGSDTGTLTQAGIGLVVLGGIALLAVRKRQAATVSIDA